MKNYKLIDNSTITRSDMLLILKWCKDYFGKSKYFPISKLKLRVKSNSKFLGQFIVDTNTIEINPNIHNSVINLIETIIHEYVHFQQNPMEFERLDRKYNFTSYYDHPHEYEAESIALKFSKKCYKDLKDKLS